MSRPAENDTPDALPFYTERENNCKAGNIYLLHKCGSWGSDTSKVKEYLDQVSNAGKLRESRLILLPIHEDLSPASLREQNAKSKKPLRLLNLPAVPIIPDSQQTLSATNSQTATANSQTAPTIPICYAKILQGICPHCLLLGNILWRNVQQVESRYESRSRSWKRNCFLQFHTIQVPVLVDLEVTLALVHHITKCPEGWQENIFAFIFVRAETPIKATSVQESPTQTPPEMNCRAKLKNHWRKIWKARDRVKKDDDKKFEDKTEETIKEHLKGIIKLYHEEHAAGSPPEDKTVGITPMLFMAALLKWYGFTAADKVVNGFESLIKIDKMLVAADKDLWQGNLEVKESCDKANVTLTNLNQSLTGLRSRVNYVEESARDMRSKHCTMIEFVRSEVGDKTADFWLDGLDKLDCAKYIQRDNDKFDLIKRAMQQYQTDIKSLKVHLTINIGLVSNFYAQLLAEEASRNNFKILIITIFSTILLPMTFASVLLSAPMFDFKQSPPVLSQPAWENFGEISGIIIGFIGIFVGAFQLYYYVRQRMQKRKEGKEKDKEEITWRFGGP